MLIKLKISPIYSHSGAHHCSARLDPTCPHHTLNMFGGCLTPKGAKIRSYNYLGPPSRLLFVYKLISVLQACASSYRVTSVPTLRNSKMLLLILTLIFDFRENFIYFLYPLTSYIDKRTWVARQYLHDRHEQIPMLQSIGIDSIIKTLG